MFEYVLGVNAVENSAPKYFFQSGILGHQFADSTSSAENPDRKIHTKKSAEQEKSLFMKSILHDGNRGILKRLKVMPSKPTRNAFQEFHLRTAELHQENRY